MEEENKGKESTFNEAVLKMQRIHDCWKSINNSRVNLLKWNYEFDKWEYEVVIANLYTQWFEVRGKCIEKEKKRFNLLRDVLEIFIETKQIYVKSIKHTFSGKKPILKFSKQNWDLIKKVINQLEDFLRDMHEVHGLSTPNVDDDELWD